jgi:hypothetical protein
VRGFEERNSDMDVVTNKWTNAQTKFIEASGLAFMRAQLHTGLTLNIEPLSMLVGRNPYQGTVEYTFEYDTRPMNLIEGARSEVISIQDNIGGELFASVFVLGRADGPVLQDLGTKPANTRTLNIEILVDPPDTNTLTARQALIDKKPSPSIPGSDFYSDLNSLVTAATPDFDTVYQTQPQESWEIKEGRYSYTTTWTYEE